MKKPGIIKNRKCVFNLAASTEIDINVIIWVESFFFFLILSTIVVVVFILHVSVPCSGADNITAVL